MQHTQNQQGWNAGIFIQPTSPIDTCQFLCLKPTSSVTAHVYLTFVSLLLLSEKCVTHEQNSGGVWGGSCVARGLWAPDKDSISELSPLRFL